MEAWVGYLAGASEVDADTALLVDAGFQDVSVEITRRYTAAEAGLEPSSLPEGWQEADGKLASAFVRATKPLSSTSGSPVIHERGRALPVAASGGCCDGATSCGCGD